MGRPRAGAAAVAPGHDALLRPFLARAARDPERVALRAEDATVLTYGQLAELSGRLAGRLLALGAGPGTRVAVLLNRGTAQVVALYAAVRAGATYVPLDADLPDARLTAMTADADPVVVLTDPGCRQRVPSGPWRTVEVTGPGTTEPDVLDPADVPPVRDARATALHILYTSGTTGRPKGVVYPAAGVVRHLEWMQSRYPFAPGDRALYKTSPGFDVSVWELFWPLAHGAELVICRPGGHGDPARLGRVVDRWGVTTLFLAPTVLSPFLAAAVPGSGRSLRWVMSGGEPVTPALRDAFRRTLPDASLVVCYGPTEAGNVTDHIAPDEPGSRVPLGGPGAGFTVELLDEQLRRVPDDAPGEAYLAGDVGLAESYWRAPARTAERFVAAAHGPPGARVYRTGDLLCRRADGLLEHLGRVDRQVKIRGNRVEPAEIESAITSHSAVAYCTVLAHGDPRRITAFVVPSSGAPADLDVDSVAAHAARLLPAYMRPWRIVALDHLPANVNGKIDEATLLASATRAGARHPAGPASPEDEVERTLLGIYAEVLGVPEVSVLDTFSALGGDSLVSFRLLDGCAAAFDRKPDISVLLTGTVRDVATSLRRAGAVTVRPGPQPHGTVAEGAAVPAGAEG